MAALENESLVMLGELREGQKRQETAFGEINEKLRVEEQPAYDNRRRIHELGFTAGLHDVGHCETVAGQAAAANAAPRKSEAIGTITIELDRLREEFVFSGK
jgi:hypothetical protein